MNGDGRRRSALLRWLPAIGWMAVLFVLSSISGLRISDDAAVDEPFRVVAHLLSHAILAGLLLHAIAGLRRPRRVEVAVAFGLTVTWGLLDEIHQAFVPGRATQLEDVAVDAVGAAIGVGIAYLIVRRSSRPAGAGSTGRL